MNDESIAKLVTSDSPIAQAILDVRNHTDMWPWYWLSYGEKCYAFATVEAYPAKEGDPFPRPGSRLDLHPTEDRLWIGENGTAMLVESEIASHETQNGGCICRFIAETHAALVKPVSVWENV